MIWMFEIHIVNAHNTNHHSSMLCSITLTQTGNTPFVSTDGHQCSKNTWEGGALWEQFGWSIVWVRVVLSTFLPTYVLSVTTISPYLRDRVRLQFGWTRTPPSILHQCTPTWKAKLQQSVEWPEVVDASLLCTSRRNESTLSTFPHPHCYSETCLGWSWCYAATSLKQSVSVPPNSVNVLQCTSTGQPSP